MSNEAQLTTMEMHAADALLTEQDVVFNKPSHWQLAKTDLIDGALRWRIWFMLAYQDIKLRYRRSLLGPFWLTISMAITVYSMGYLYAHLFHAELSHYYPFLVAGMLSWSLLSTIVTELTEGWTAFDSFIKQVKLPYSLYMHRIACRNLLIFFHNVLVMIPVYLIFFHEVRINLNTLLVIPGLIAIYLNTILYGLALSMIGARFRDISQIIKSFVGVIFFVTPVMWTPDLLGSKKYLVDLNPFYAFIELIRQPLLGGTPTLKNILVATLATLFGAFIGLKLFTRYRARIIYWI